MMLMRFPVLAIALVAMLGSAAGQDKLGENSKIFGRKPPKDGRMVIRPVSGTVRDKDEKAVGGATVYLMDTKTKKERAVVADANGNYRFEELDPTIDYRLRAAKAKLESPPKTLSSFDTRRDPVINLTVEEKTAPQK
jgi:hypothetical protein